MREIILVALGGAFGSTIRYLLSIYTSLFFGRSFLLTGTMVVNVTGCVLIGALIQWFEIKQMMDTGLRMLVLVGFLGGFTTFSTFGLESFEIFRESVSNALLYISLHLVLGIGGVWFGLVGCQWLLK